ncbi:hypothetical protein [Ruegeria arenilitoris]|uniref:hypothetical protein n=1 Tax=Ruegeria arenilitoris TaxID=1173585 RepID=UPI00147CC076|nr:hypothetical protein [Ruegeria arenilitoris]
MRRFLKCYALQDRVVEDVIDDEQMRQENRVFWKPIMGSGLNKAVQLAMPLVTFLSAAWTLSETQHASTSGLN